MNKETGLDAAARELPLAGRVAVVAGATRGAGRAIAVTLAAAGATVYATGRSVRGNPSDINRAETIDETADIANARGGGTCIAIRVDHTDPEQVEALFARVTKEQDGRLDILVNDVWGGEHWVSWEPYWKQSLSNGLQMQQRGVHTHMITSHYATPLMVARGSGLIVEVTDGYDYRFRGNLYYSLAKISVIHLAEGMNEELRPHGVHALAVSPGFLRSEQMLDYFGVKEENWRDAIAKDPHYAESETPYYLAQGLAALAADPELAGKAGKVWTSWSLSDEYGIVDIDGRRPHWGRYAAQQGF